MRLQARTLMAVFALLSATSAYADEARIGGCDNPGKLLRNASTKLCLTAGWSNPEPAVKPHLTTCNPNDPAQRWWHHHRLGSGFTHETQVVNLAPIAASDTGACGADRRAVYASQICLSVEDLGEVDGLYHAGRAVKAAREICLGSDLVAQLFNTRRQKSEIEDVQGGIRIGHRYAGLIEDGDGGGVDGQCLGEMTLPELIAFADTFGGTVDSEAAYYLKPCARGLRIDRTFIPCAPEDLVNPAHPCGKP